MRLSLSGQSKAQHLGCYPILSANEHAGENDAIQTNQKPQTKPLATM